MPLNVPSQRTMTGTARSALWMASWIAIMTGVIEVLLVVYRTQHDGGFTNRTRDVYWLAPSAYLLLFLAPAVLLVLLGRWWPRLPVLWLTVSGTTAASITALLITQFGPSLHPVALLFLALGGGIQAARAVTHPSSRFPRLAERTVPWMLLLLAGAAVGLPGLRMWRERQLATSLAAARRGAPNVLLLVLDTVRAASLSLYGYSRPTSPTLDQLGQRGVVFDQALSTAPWTLPSHASIFTGRWPHELTTSWFRPLDRSDSTLAEALSARGYATGGFVANLIYAHSETGLGRGFQRYRDFRFGLGLVLRSCTLTRRITDSRLLRTLTGSDEVLGRKPAATVNAEFLDWLDGAGQRPFFGFLNYFDAHDPYLPPEDWFLRIAGYARPNHLSPLRRLGIRQRKDRMRPEDIRLERDSYDASIAWLDHEIGRLLAELERRGLRENTIIVVTSDHGEEFGEHGVFLHGHSLYRDALHVPLIIVAPGRMPQGDRVGQPVSLRELPATILGLIDGDSNTTFPGASLARHWSGMPLRDEAPVLSEVQQAVRMPEWYPAATGDLRALTDTTYHFIQSPDSSHQLFDWVTDPAERTNLYPTAQGQARAESYLARLRQLPPFPPPSRGTESP